MNDVQSRALFRRALTIRMNRVHMKKETLALLTGANKSHVVRWLEGDLMPEWRQFHRILQVFGADSEDFIGNSASESSYSKRFKRG